MIALRHLLRTHPGLLGGLALCALAIRLLVPAGYMPHVAHDGLAIVACPGMAIAAPAHHAGHDASHEPADTGQPCAYAALTAPSLGAADPKLLAVALAFAMLLALRPVVPLPTRTPSRWRPPLRAPPTPSPIR